MSRHGTFVNRKKLPPHDPYLLHEGDTVKFGQSLRVYILKGATIEGSSAPVKKTWSGRVKLKAPRIGLGTVLAKKSTPKKYSTVIMKLIGDICHGTVSDEKLQEFVTTVRELNETEKRVGSFQVVENE